MFVVLYALGGREYRFLLREHRASARGHAVAASNHLHHGSPSPLPPVRCGPGEGLQVSPQEAHPQLGRATEVQICRQVCFQGRWVAYSRDVVRGSSLASLACK